MTRERTPERTPERAPQLAYSEIQEKTHDQVRRQRKAAKILAVLRHFLGREDLNGLVALDVGCSTGFLADVLRADGARVIGMDIDRPGLAHAQQRFGEQIGFVCADGGAMPLADASVDVVVFNQVYEHVVDADAVMAEITRVLAPHGAAFFGFGNKYQVIEPHYRLPFLSWLPVRVADRYVAASGRAADYYERFRTRRGLLRMCRGLTIWDYTYAVLADAQGFDATDVVPRGLRRAPAWFWRSLQAIMPTFLWVGTPGTDQPRGPAVRVSPTRLVP